MKIHINFLVVVICLIEILIISGCTKETPIQYPGGVESTCSNYGLYETIPEGQTCDQTEVCDETGANCVTCYTNCRSLEEESTLPSTFQSYKYIMEVSTTTSAGKTSRATINTWLKEPNLKTDMTIIDENGKQEHIIFIKKGNTYYNYMPEENKAIKTKDMGWSLGPMYASFFSEYSFDATLRDEQIRSAMEESCGTDCSVAIVGHETVFGTPCTVFETTATKPASTGKVWIAKNKGYIVKMESKSMGDTTIIEFKDIEINKPILDSVFELPPGVEIEDLTSVQ